MEGDRLRIRSPDVVRNDNNPSPMDVDDAVVDIAQAYSLRQAFEIDVTPSRASRSLETMLLPHFERAPRIPASIQRLQPPKDAYIKLFCAYDADAPENTVPESFRGMVDDLTGHFMLEDSRHQDTDESLSQIIRRAGPDQFVQGFPIARLQKMARAVFNWSKDEGLRRVFVGEDQTSALVQVNDDAEFVRLVADIKIRDAERASQDFDQTQGSRYLYLALQKGPIAEPRSSTPPVVLDPAQIPLPSTPTMILNPFQVTDPQPSTPPTISDPDLAELEQVFDEIYTRPRYIRRVRSVGNLDDTTRGNSASPTPLPRNLRLPGLGDNKRPASRALTNITAASSDTPDHLPHRNRPFLSSDTPVPPSSAPTSVQPTPSTDEDDATPTAEPSITTKLFENWTGADGLFDLNAHLPDAVSPTEEEWARVCDLLFIRPNDHRDPKARSIRIPKTQIHATPLQLWTAYYMLTSKSRAELDGGILADMMGSGKTWIVLIYAVLRILFLTSARDVALDENRRDNLKRHGTVNGNSNQCRCEQNRNDPSSVNLGIRCYFPQTSTTRHIADQLATGPTLIQFPNSAIPSFLESVESSRLDARYFTTFAYVGNMTTTIRRPERGELKRHLLDGMMTATISEQTMQRNGYSATWQPTCLDVNYSYRPDDASDPKKQVPGRTPFPEKLIVLATHITVPRFLEELEMTVEVYTAPPTTPDSRQGSATRDTRKVQVMAAPVGAYIVDEFHQVNSPRSVAVRSANRFKHIRNGKFHFWAVTGTPLTDALSGRTDDLAAISPVLSILERPEWGNQGHRHNMRSTEKVAKLLQDISITSAEGLLNTVDECDRFRPLITALLADDLVIRNTEKTLFLGRPSSAIQPVKVNFISTGTPKSQLTDMSTVCHEVLQVLQKRIEGSHDLTQIYEEAANPQAWDDLERLRLLSTFPGAAPALIGSPEKRKFDISTAAMEAELAKSDPTDHISPSKSAEFAKVFEKFTRDSPKLVAINLIIDQMLENQKKETRPAQQNGAPSTRRSATRHVNPSLQKLVIVTSSLCEAVFLQMALAKQRPQLKPVLLPGKIRTSLRRQILEDWDDLTVPARGPKTQILITPFDVGGTALNLQTANWQIVTGPLRTRNDEAQAFGRTNRSGQQLKVRHFMLGTHDNPYDRVRLIRRAGATPKMDLFDVHMTLDADLP